MCQKCGKPINQSQITRNSTCEFCGSDLHSCINCNFYSVGNHYDCKETIDELVKDKEKANFCDYFRVKKDFSMRNGPESLNKISDAKDAFKALFN